MTTAALTPECAVCGTLHDDALHGAVLRVRGQLRAEVARQLAEPEVTRHGPDSDGPRVRFNFMPVGDVRIVRRQSRKRP